MLHQTQKTRCKFSAFLQSEVEIPSIKEPSVPVKALQRMSYWQHTDKRTGGLNYHPLKQKHHEIIQRETTAASVQQKCWTNSSRMDPNVTLTSCFSLYVSLSRLPTASHECMEKQAWSQRKAPCTWAAVWAVLSAGWGADPHADRLPVRNLADTLTVLPNCWCDLKVELHS